MSRFVFAVSQITRVSVDSLFHSDMTVNSRSPCLGVLTACLPRATEYRRHRTELKKRAAEALKQQKKAHKLKSPEARRSLDLLLSDVQDRYQVRRRRGRGRLPGEGRPSDDRHQQTVEKDKGDGIFI